MTRKWESNPIEGYFVPDLNGPKYEEEDDDENDDGIDDADDEFLDFHDIDNLADGKMVESKSKDLSGKYYLFIHLYFTGLGCQRGKIKIVKLRTHKV